MVVFFCYWCGIVAGMGFPTFVADHGCVSSPPNMMIHMALVKKISWVKDFHGTKEGKWSFRLMPFRLKSFRLTCLVTSPNFFRRNVFYFGHFA